MNKLKDPTNESTSELAIARVSVTTTCVGKRLKGSDKTVKAYREKRSSQMCSDWRLLAWGRWKQANKKQGTLGDRFGSICFFLVVPELEVWVKSQRPGSPDSDSSDKCCETTRLPGLVV